MAKPKLQRRVEDFVEEYFLGVLFDIYIAVRERIGYRLREWRR